MRVTTLPAAWLKCTLHSESTLFVCLLNNENNKDTTRRFILHLLTVSSCYDGKIFRGTVKLLHLDFRAS